MRSFDDLFLQHEPHSGAIRVPRQRYLWILLSPQQRIFHIFHFIIESSRQQMLQILILQRAESESRITTQLDGL